MSRELQMALADCGSPETLIAAFLKHLPDVAPPIDIHALARIVGITEIRAMDFDGFEGALITDANKSVGAILFRSGRPRQRERFTVGHELGHFLIPTHRGDRKCTAAHMREANAKDPARRIEAEANRFSAGILMPRPLFERDLDRLGDADVSHVQTLAKRYDTSLEASVNRYTDLTGDVCAFVFSVNGVVRYVRATADFPKMAVWKGNPLPPSSASVSRRPTACRQPSSWSETEPHVWLADASRSIEVVLEQTVVQQNGYQITLLFLDPAVLADAEEEEQLEADWTPGFR